MTTWIALVLSASASPRVADTLPLGTAVEGVVASSDGRWVAALEDASGQIRVLDVFSWDVSATSVCGGTGAAGLAAWESEGALRFYTGCADGTVDYVELERDAFDNPDGSVSLSAGAVLGVAVSSGRVLAVAEATDGEANPAVHIVVPDEGDAVDSSGSYPMTLGYPGLVDMEADATNLFVAHGGDKVSRVDVSSGSAVIRQQGIGSAECSDVLPPTSTVALLAGGPAGVIQFQVSSNDLAIVLSGDDGVEDATALARFGGGEELVVADSDRAEFVAFPLSEETGLPGDTEQYAVAFDAEATADTTVTKMVASGDYLVAGTSTGELWVVTDVPWVEATASPSSALTGDAVTVSFTSDMEGEWELRLGASSDSDGDVVASGSIAAGGTEETEIVVDESFAEGRNLLRVVVDSGGLVGHDAAVVTVDNPPSVVSFGEGNVKFGNSQLIVDFDGIDDEDLASYEVYVSVTPFSAEDWPDGGPEFDGDDDIETPVVITAGPGEHVTHAIAPLTNDTTYYLAVRAIDSGGQEGPMSNVVSGTPQETFGAAELAGEEGGMCGPALPVTGLLSAAGAIAAALRRRRANGGWQGAPAYSNRAPGGGGEGKVTHGRGMAKDLRAAARAAVVLGAALAGTARAQDEAPAPDKKRIGTVELRYGPAKLEDKNITRVFGSTGNEVLWLEFGPTWGSVAEFKAGVGFFQEMGYLVSEDGTPSYEHDMLTAFPFTANATVRLDFLREQFLVPVASMGADYWAWRENWYVDEAIGGLDRIGGGKYGWHWALGGQVLLDSFDPGRASKLEARTGVTDSYVVFEYREQAVGATQKGLDFSGSMVTIGLKVDH